MHGRIDPYWTFATFTSQAFAVVAAAGHDVGAGLQRVSAVGVGLRELSGWQ